MWFWMMQIFLLLTFAVVSISAEWRKTGLILSGFALLYLSHAQFTAQMDAFSPPYYVLVSVVLDLAAMHLLIRFGSKGAVIQTWILGMFVTTHLFAYLYTVGLTSPIDPHQYVVITFALAILQMIAAWPGIKAGLYDILGMVEEILERRLVAGGSVRLHPAYSDGATLSHDAGHGSTYQSPGPSDIHGARRQGQTGSVDK